MLTPKTRAVAALVATAILPIIWQLAPVLPKLSYSSAEGTVTQITLVHEGSHLKILPGPKHEVVKDGPMGEYVVSYNYMVNGVQRQGVDTSIDQFFLPGWEPLLVGHKVHVLYNPLKENESISPSVLGVFALLASTTYFATMGWLAAAGIYIQATKNISQAKTRLQLGEELSESCNHIA